MPNEYVIATGNAEASALSLRSKPSLLLQPALVLAAVGAFALPFPRVAQLPFAGSYLELSDAFFVLAGLCRLASLVRGAERLVWRTAYAPLACYVACCAGSYWVAPERQSWLVHMAAALYQSGLCVMLAHLLANASRRRLFVYAWLLGAALTALLGLVGAALFYLGVKGRAENPFLWNYGSVPVGNYPRLCVLFRNANALCNYLVLAIGVALAFRPELPALVRRFTPHAIAGAMVVALFTLSPGFGGILLLLALWFWGSSRARGGSKWARLALVGGIAAALGFTLVSVVSVVARGHGAVPLGPLDLAFTGSPRISVWSSALHTIEKNPLFGQGLGAPLAWVTDARVLVPQDQWNDALLAKRFAPNPVDAHNTALNILGQLGVLGLLCFAAFLYCVFNALAASGSRARWALIATLAGGVLYHGLFLSLEEMRHVWLLLGLCLAVAYSQAPETSEFGLSSLPASS